MPLHIRRGHSAARPRAAALKSDVRQVEARDLAKTAVLIVDDLQEARIGGVRDDRHAFSIGAHGERFRRGGDAYGVRNAEPFWVRDVDRKETVTRGQILDGFAFLASILLALRNESRASVVRQSEDLGRRGHGIRHGNFSGLGFAVLELDDGQQVSVPGFSRRKPARGIALTGEIAVRYHRDRPAGKLTQEIWDIGPRWSLSQGGGEDDRR